MDNLDFINISKDPDKFMDTVQAEIVDPGALNIIFTLLSALNSVEERVSALEEQISRDNHKKFVTKSESIKDLSNIDTNTSCENQSKNKHLEKEVQDLKSQINEFRRKVYSYVKSTRQDNNGNHHSAAQIIKDSPVIDVYSKVDDNICPNCGTGMVPMGETSVGLLAYIPGGFFLIRDHKEKLICKHCAAKDHKTPTGEPLRFTKTALGRAVLPHCALDPSLAAVMIISKFADCLPAYRQQHIFARHDVNLSRSTIVGWLCNIADHLDDFVEVFHTMLLDSTAINADETTIKVHNEEGRTDTSNSFFWVSCSSDSNCPPIRYVYYTPARKHEIVFDILKGFQGYLQTDGYPGYNEFARSVGITHVPCMAHIRRKFYDVVHTALKAAQTPEEIKLVKSSIAYIIITMICEIYIKDHEIRVLREQQKLSPDAFLKARDKAIRPLLDNLIEKITAEKDKYPPSSLMGKACNYAVNQLPSMYNYLGHADLTLDNNLAERNVKVIVMSRKNYLFCQSPRGAKAAAIFYTLILTAIACGLNPEQYLYNLLLRFRSTPREKWSEIFPWNIKMIPLPRFKEDFQGAVIPPHKADPPPAVP